MTLDRKRKPTLLILASLFAVLLLYLACVIAEGYLRAPQIVPDHMAARSMTLRPEDLSADQLRILLTVEDPAFFTHRGVDLFTPGAGMTTITQGLIKFLYFERFQPGIAKIRQSLLAIGFDARIDKRTQLTICLNSAYLGAHRGRQVRGFADAARIYHAKEFAQLTRAEYISLVAMLVGPETFNVATRRERNTDRAARIERLLDGRCRPDGWLDVLYASCGGS